MIKISKREGTRTYIHDENPERREKSPNWKFSSEFIKTLKNTILTFTIAGALTMGSLPVEAALGDSVLKKGMDHEDIQVLQEELKNIGYFDNEITTYYGDITQEAVKNFQAKQGLDQDGVFGISTYAVLNCL